MFMHLEKVEVRFWWTGKAQHLFMAVRKNKFKNQFMSTTRRYPKSRNTKLCTQRDPPPPHPYRLIHLPALHIDNGWGAQVEQYI